VELPHRRHRAGSWWAYYELGWGGWVFWDPVENASFMRGSSAPALIHSLRRDRKRGSFKSWTVLLAIFAFSLSLLGTFLVPIRRPHVGCTRSPPTRSEESFILGFLVLVIGGSLALLTHGVRQRSGSGVSSRPCRASRCCF